MLHCQNQLYQSVRENLLSLTGCDTVIIQWIWQEEMLENLSETTKFTQSYWTQLSRLCVACLYGVSTQTNVNQARLHLFVKKRKDLDMLPPTRDTLDLHCKRATYQARIWYKQIKNRSLYPNPQTHCMN